MTLKSVDMNADPDAALPNWRVCSSKRVVKDGDPTPLTLVINSTTAVVMGITPDNSTVMLNDENLTGLLDIGATIKIARVQHGMSGEFLGKTIGATGQTVRYWEDGSRVPRERQRQRLDRVLGTHLSTKATKEQI